MSTSTIIYRPFLKTDATHNRSGVTITTDAPVDNNGQGAFFSPTDLAATSLASCMLTVMGIYADQNQLELGEIDCSLTKVMAANPRRISEIHIEANWKTKLQDKEIEKLKKVAYTCPVANSLHPDIKQVINFNITRL
ncbi:redox protein [Marivirga lumbricoides]|uniref:Redox protein n=2 Tax=Marivirga lumbricoides TaxID=1046115 RepID=A0ABQ1MKT9_9BACT|nr:redox protein [Marivirga lumbricoides]